MGGLLGAKVLTTCSVNIEANSEYLIPITKVGQVVLVVEGSSAVASFLITRDGEVRDFTTTYNQAIDLDNTNLLITVYSKSNENYKLKVKNNSQNNRNMYFTIQSPS